MAGWAVAWRRMAGASLGLGLAGCGGGGPSQTPSPPPVAPPAPVVLAEAYGPLPLQSGTLFLPAGAGPHPLAVVVHGGCWLRGNASAAIMDRFSMALARAGWAAWNVEYRIPGDPQYAWPDTFLDIGAAMDHLPELAARHRLDLSRSTIIGHSAGGHLALWAASRPQLDAASVLARPSPTLPARAIGLAAITDLERYRAEGLGCGTPVPALVGSEAPDAARWAETSPLAMLPPAVPVTLVVADSDTVVRADQAERYATAALQAGATVRVLPVAGGHFAPINPDSSAFAAVLDLLGPP